MLKLKNKAETSKSLPFCFPDCSFSDCVALPASQKGAIGWRRKTDMAIEALELIDSEVDIGTLMF